MAEKKRTRWQRRPGTTGGKLPWNDWRNATTWRKATQLLLLAINIYIAITFWYWVRYYETAGSTTFRSGIGCAITKRQVVRHLSPDREVSKAGYRLPV